MFVSHIFIHDRSCYLLFSFSEYSCKRSTITSFNINCLSRIYLYPVPLKGLLSAIAFCLPLALFWSYQSRSATNNLSLPISFTNISRKTTIFYLSIFLYLASFHWWWDDTSTKKADSFDLSLNNPLVLTILIFTISTIYWWYKLGQRQNSNALWRLDIHSTYIAIAITISSILLSINFNNYSLGSFGTITFNLLLFALGLILIRHALKSEKRLGYWSGVILLSLQVLSRMFEYNTDLLVKALVLFICGLGVIMAGIWFEKYLAKSTSST